MTDEQELQSEEREVLASIYEGDERFKEISSNSFQYKYGEDESIKSFLIEIKWGEKYPNELPIVEMELFYNKHISSNLKEKIVQLITNEAKEYLGMSMTYSLFEFMKEHFEDLTSQEENIDGTGDTDDKLVVTENDQQENKKILKKEILSKAQKRRQWHRLDGKGEKPRGWNWVDIVKHLSQTGSKDTTTPSS